MGHRMIGLALSGALVLCACKKSEAPSAADATSKAPASGKASSSPAPSAKEPAPPRPTLPAVATEWPADFRPSFGAAYDDATRKAYEGKSWSEALALLEVPVHLEALRPALEASAKRKDREGSAARILLASLDRRAPLLRRLNAFKDDAKDAGPFACDARLHAYAVVSSAMATASRSGNPKEMMTRHTQLLSVLAGLALPPQGAARILCGEGFLGGCDARGPTVAGAAYVQSIRAQIDALLLHGVRGCGAHGLSRLLEGIVAKEERLAGLPITSSGRLDWKKLGLRPFPLLDF